MAGERSIMLKVSVEKKSFSEDNGREKRVLGRIEFQVNEGEVVCILGPSGCGKTTLLRIIAGLDVEYRGTVTLDGKKVCGPDRSRGLMFQDSRLLPWKTVSENLQFALPDCLEDSERRERIEQALSLVGLGQAGSLWPRELSGGMERRAAFARAMVNQAQVLLLDEPFSALDSFTKFKLHDRLDEIQTRQGITMVVVTHDIDEAVYLSDRLLILSDRPAEVVTQRNIGLERPRRRFSRDYELLREEVMEETVRIASG